jgi:hypothetical protein
MVKTMDYNTAKTKLSSLLRCLPELCDSDCKLIAHMIKKFPKLASESFLVHMDCFTDWYQPLLPLVGKLPLGVEEHLALVKMVYEANPEVIYNTRVLLYTCEKHAPDEVIIFLIDKYKRKRAEWEFAQALYKVLSWENPSVAVIQAIMEDDPCAGITNLSNEDDEEDDDEDDDDVGSP